MRKPDRRICRATVAQPAKSRSIGPAAGKTANISSAANAESTSQCPDLPRRAIVHSVRRPRLPRLRCRGHQREHINIPCCPISARPTNSSPAGPALRFRTDRNTSRTRPIKSFQGRRARTISPPNSAVQMPKTATSSSRRRMGPVEVSISPAAQPRQAPPPVDCFVKRHAAAAAAINGNEGERTSLQRE